MRFALAREAIGQAAGVVEQFFFFEIQFWLLKSVFHTILLVSKSFIHKKITMAHFDPCDIFAPHHIMRAVVALHSLLWWVLANTL